MSDLFRVWANKRYPIGCLVKLINSSGPTGEVVENNGENIIIKWHASGFQGKEITATYRFPSDFALPFMQQAKIKHAEAYIIESKDRVCPVEHVIKCFAGSDTPGKASIPVFYHIPV